MRTDHKFIVMCIVDFGDLDTIESEYSGEEYTDYDSAVAEMREADRDPRVTRAWISHLWMEDGELWGEELYS